MSILKGLREDHEALAKASGVWAENLERAAGAGRELNSITPKAAVSESTAGETLGMVGTQVGRADNLGNFTEAFGLATGQASNAGQAGSATRSKLGDHIAYTDGKGGIALVGPIENIIGMILGGVFVAGHAVRGEDGGLVAILDAGGNDILHGAKPGNLNFTAGPGGGQSGGSSGPGGASLDTSQGRRSTTTISAPPPTQGVNGVSAGDRAIIAAIGGLREELKLNMPLKTLVQARQ